jgi:hypothetical protein
MKQNDILEALKTRLRTITIANGYPITVKKVTTGAGITMNKDKSELPLIDIVNNGLDIDTNYMGQVVKVRFPVTLRLVLKKEATDQNLIEFQSCVIRALFNNNYNTSLGEKDAMKLGGLVSHMLLESTAPDYNLIEANRMLDINVDIFFSINIIDL